MVRTRNQDIVIVDGPKLVSRHLTETYFDMALALQKEITCPVCLEDWLSCKRCAAILQCGHEIHIGCFLRMSGDKCPICRQ